MRFRVRGFCDGLNGWGVVEGGNMSNCLEKVEIFWQKMANWYHGWK